MKNPVRRLLPGFQKDNVGAQIGAAELEMSASDIQRKSFIFHKTYILFFVWTHFFMERCFPFGIFWRIQVKVNGRFSHP